MDDHHERRRPEASGPEAGAGGWLTLGDDELLYRIESLRSDHDRDGALLAIVRSDRHFFIRQEAANKIRDPELLKAFDSYRHIGQILVRQMGRVADVAYLERLVRETRHLEVRKAAETQLCLIRAALARRS